MPRRPTARPVPGSGGSLSSAVRATLIAALLSALPYQTLASALTVYVADGHGQPLESAVVTLSPARSSADGERRPAASTNAVLAQRGHRFVPFVLPIARGTRVEFPNFDDTRHHVYSFSPTRPFEIELYRGDPETTIDFPETGVAAIGCNIHDWMEAFVFVTDAPYFALSRGDGTVVFANLPDEAFEVAVWHPWQVQESPARVVASARTATEPVVFDLRLSPPPPRRPAENALQLWMQTQ